MYEVRITVKQAGTKGGGEGEMERGGRGGGESGRSERGERGREGGEREREGRQRERDRETENSKLNSETFILKDSIGSIRSILDLSNYSLSWLYYKHK